MSSTIMVGNTTGWNKVGDIVVHANTGHASNMVGIMLEDELVQLEVGQYHDTHNLTEKREFNQALLIGWVAHVHANCRIHTETGAILEISRKFEDENGKWVRARYTRTG